MADMPKMPLLELGGDGPNLAVALISEEQANLVTEIEEGQFSDVKAAAIAPSKLSKTLAAFANADGGDLYIGIGEKHIGGGAKIREWAGFPDVEAANGHLQSLEVRFPLGTDFRYEFLRCETRPGLVLYIQVSRSKAIHRADDRLPYVRRGAHNEPVATAEQLKRLELTKGIVSFETELVNVSKEVVTESPVTIGFLEHVVPSAEPDGWLRKQSLLHDGRPTVAAVLLFGEEPQAQLPKRCGIKVYRYKTKDPEGFRDVLAFDPITVEGCLYSQIKNAVRMTLETAENIPKMGDSSLEKIQYPHETLHEIITNAVIHRDYSIADDVHIRIFDNRIEIQSPGRFPAHVTPKNFLKERFARNGSIVRLLNKFPDPPNKDVGEGLNTAFEKMHQLGLKEPTVIERDNDVLVTVRHETLASPEEAILTFLSNHPTINNKKARQITHISQDYRIKNIFRKMEQKGMIEQVPETRTSATAYRLKNQATPAADAI